VITVAITTYNRGDIVANAVQSALDFVGAFAGKVVLVDDGSTDATTEVVGRNFQGPIKDGTLAITKHTQNLGVTAAKNSAFILAEPGWVLFLDSDDELIAGTATKVAATLSQHDGEALIFFRCIDESGTFVGTYFSSPQRLSLRRYSAHASYGEAFTAINKAVAPDPPFDADLKGYEGIGCARLIKFHGPALLTTEIVRRYNRSRPDRLSSFSGFLRRAMYLSRGHFRYISVFGDYMSLANRASMLCKALGYYLVGSVARIWIGNG
jgi:glycosyltransferase involved in cell wall biosynthesis